MSTARLESLDLTVLRDAAEDRGDDASPSAPASGSSVAVICVASSRVGAQTQENARLAGTALAACEARRERDREPRGSSRCRSCRGRDVTSGERGGRECRPGWERRGDAAVREGRDDRSGEGRRAIRRRPWRIRRTGWWTLVDKFVGAFGHSSCTPTAGDPGARPAQGGDIAGRQDRSPQEMLVLVHASKCADRREGSVLRRWTPGKRTSSTRNHTGLRRSRGCRGDHPAGYRPTHSDVPVANV